MVGAGLLGKGSWPFWLNGSWPPGLRLRNQSSLGRGDLFEGVNIQDVLIQAVLVPLVDPYPPRTADRSQSTHTHTHLERASEVALSGPIVGLRLPAAVSMLARM